MRTSGFEGDFMTSLTMLQTFCFGHFDQAAIEPVVSITKTSSIVGLPPATSFTCAAGSCWARAGRRREQDRRADKKTLSKTRWFTSR